MKLILAVLIFLSAAPAKAAQPDSVKKFIDSALNTMQRKSVFSKHVNWKAIRDTAYALTKNASTYMEAAPGIKYAFNALGDMHGWLVFRDEVYRNPGYEYDTSRTTANIKQAFLKGPRIYAGIVKNEFAYISIPFFGGKTAAQMNAFAQRIQDSLLNIINEKTKGIIIDLRLNAGGNMFPMFAGLSNILGETDFAIYPAVNGNGIERSAITKNGVSVNGNIITPLPKTYGDLSAHPVAIILGPVTASAGECLAAGFVGRDKTIFVGENTAGFTTANDGFLLHADDYGMVLAVDYLRDRYGNIYVEHVKPDIHVIGGDDFFDHDKDKKIKAAVSWLQKQK